MPISLSWRRPRQSACPCATRDRRRLSAPILISLRSGSSTNFSTTTAVENGISCAHRQKYFLAHDLFRDHPLGLIGVFIRRHQRRALGQHPLDDRDSSSSTFSPVQRADRNDLRLGQSRGCIPRSAAAIGARDAIDLVDRNDARTALSARNSISTARSPAFRWRARFDHGDHDFALGDGTARGLHHPLVRAASSARAVRACRSRSDLRVGVAADSENAPARGLRPWRDDRDLVPDHAIHQRRFADVGAPARPRRSLRDAGSCALTAFFFYSVQRERARRPARSASCCRPRPRRVRARRFGCAW